MARTLCQSHDGNCQDTLERMRGPLGETFPDVPAGELDALGATILFDGMPIYLTELVELARAHGYHGHLVAVIEDIAEGVLAVG